MQATAEVPAAKAAVAPKLLQRIPSARPAKTDAVRIWRITVRQYHRMGEAGILRPDERVELLDGQLIQMPPIGPPHDYAVACLGEEFRRRFEQRAFVKVQGAVTLDRWSEPQPDVTLNALPKQRYAVAHPTPNEVLLIVEVAAASRSYDAGKKMRAYARRGIREYWIVDLVHERVEIYREPKGERYKQHHTAGRGETVAPGAFPDDALAVDDILPPPR